MNNYLTGLLILVLLSAVNVINAEPNLPNFEQPVLLTAAGQAADVLIMRGLCLRAGINVTVMNQATADSLKGFKTIILAAGGSSKGLGAAKVDVSAEQNRINNLIKSAEKLNIPIVTFHIGGEARRGPISDPFNEIAAKGAQVVVVAADGDVDGFFKKIASEKKSIYQKIPRTADAVEILKTIFTKESSDEE